MARSSKQESLEFGSDSFLDIIANIVGILIILIVIAGLRVSRAPITPPPVTPPVDPTEVASVAPPVAAPEVDQSTTPEQLESAAPSVVEDPLPDVESLFADERDKEPPAPLPAPEPPAELVAQADRLKADISAAIRDRDAQRQRNSRIGEQAEIIRQRADRLQQDVEVESRALEVAQQSAVERTADQDRAARQLQDLKAAVRLTLDQPPATQVLNHRVTPVGREVTRGEVHFRLGAGRVSVVPLQSLTASLKGRIERNKDMLFRLERYEGTVGPLNGYLLHYTVQRQQVSVLEELRNGGPMVRIGLSYYEIEPQPGMPTESADEALQHGSRFREAIQLAGPDATLTFWVYPDSFDLHRRLQEFAHARGFDVAARPLPQGVPIAGSPNGSRSVAQ